MHTIHERATQFDLQAQVDCYGTGNKLANMLQVGYPWEFCQWLLGILFLTSLKAL